MKLAYVDSSIWITYIEGLTCYQQHIDEELNKLAEDGYFFAISDVVKLEILPKLYLSRNDKMLALYQALFGSLVLLDNFPNVFQKALKIAQQEGLKAIDSIHLAIAIQQGCECFISTDNHFRKIQSLPVVWIDIANLTKNLHN